MVIILDREHSDHSPLVLRPSKQDFGPPKFRFFNSWLYKDGFNEEFLKVWNSFSGFGIPVMFLKSKLKYLNACICKWRIVDSNKELETLKQSKARVSKLELMVESRALSDGELLER